MKNFLRLSVIVYIVAGLTLTGYAQTNSGQISGRVTDPSGAAVHGAQVILTNQATGVARTDKT